MIVAFLAVCLIALSEVGGEPCVGYETITNQRRSIRYMAKATEPNICDQTSIDESKWYRFIVLPPSRMHDSCVHGKICGTDSPVFINGGHHPTENDPGPKDVEVCSSQDGVCCKAWKSTIKVKFCRADDNGDGDFYVYQLKRVPRCDMAYCAGDALVCQKEEIYNPNSKTCTERSPKIGTPVFEGPRLIQKTLQADGKAYEDFYFVCNVNLDADPDAASKGQRIEVVFTFDGQEIPSCVAPTIINGITDREVPLQSSQLKGHCLDKAVSCKVRSFWNNLDKHKSQFIPANEDRFVGFEYSLTTVSGSFKRPPIAITVNEGDPPLTIYFRSTVPISCPDKDDDTSCKISVRIEDIPDTDRIGVGSCSMTFNGLESTGKLSELRVQALLTAGIHHRSSVIRFKPVEAHKDFFWNGYQLYDIHITVTDSSTQMWCSSAGDPHIRTFDGRQFDDMTIGDYILAKSDKSTFEVHVRQFKCATVSCNCGVAVREGNDVVVINVCVNPAVMPTVFSVGESDGAKVTNKANQYTISMPSGAYVDVNYRYVGGYGHLLDLTVFESSQNIRHASGMCSVSKGNYKLDPEDSLMNARKGGIKCEETSTATVASVCSCRKDNTPIACKGPQVDMKDVVTMPYMEEARHCLTANNKQRRRRDVGRKEAMDDGDSDDNMYEMMITADEFPMPEVDENHGKNYNNSLKWPTPSGIDETKAKSLCQSTLESSMVFQVCKNDVQMKDIEGIIKDCVTDIQILDNTDMAMGGVVDNFQMQCVTVLENKVNVNHTNQSATGQPSEDQTRLLLVTSTICPNQCNGKGNCNNGTCKCNSGFAGDDCSTDTRNPPDLTAIRKGSLCDSRTSVCTVALIYANNFYRSKDLLCKITEKSGEYKHPGSMVSQQMVSCRLPLVHRFSNKSRLTAREAVELDPAPFYRWEVAVSNDAGKLFSNSLPLTVFDSKCQICNNDGNCVRKNNTCEIEGRCYSAKEVSDHDLNLGCLPSKSQEKWSTCGAGDGCGNASIIRTGHMTIAALALIASFMKSLY